MDQQKMISSAFHWYNQIHDAVINSYKELIQISAYFKKMLEIEKLKLPYNINVIDELHINENAHSRILYKLLLYKNAIGEYEILNSLISFIRNNYGKSSVFDKIEVVTPLITQEVERIDLWIRDKKYAIIFENKIYNAQDQEAQLARYIDKTKAQGYKTDQIFIIYLSSAGEEPDEQSWGKYKELFNDRYINLSFRNNIIKWLKEIVLPNIRIKDIYLQSAVTQYIDYLEGLFYLRTIEKNLNMNLNKFLISQFELEKANDPQKDFNTLQEKIDDMNEVINAMRSLQDSYKQIIIKDWKAKTNAQFPNLKPCQLGAYSDVSIPDVNGKTIKVFILEDAKGLYCQVEYTNTSSDEERNISGTIIESLQDILPSSNRHCIWKYLPLNAFDEVFSLFEKVTKRLCEQLHVS